MLPLGGIDLQDENERAAYDADCDKGGHFVMQDVLVTCRRHVDRICDLE